MNNRLSRRFAAFFSFTLFLGVLTIAPQSVGAAELGVPDAPVATVEGSVVRWTQPDNGVDVAGHNVHRGDGSYVTTVTSSQQWDAGSQNGSYFVTAFDSTPGGALISARSNVVEVRGGAAAPSADEPDLPDGFRCGNWPPVASNDTRNPVTLDAQDAASEACGVTYSDQNRDVCEWMSDPAGWRCMIRDDASEPAPPAQPTPPAATVPTLPAPSTSAPALPDGFRCGNWPPVQSNDQRSPVTLDAQDAASEACGATYSDQNRDRCDWVGEPAGWRCMIRDAETDGGGGGGSTPPSNGPAQPVLPDGFSCGNWPPVPSNDARSPVTLDAQDAASAACGVTYDAQNRDRCDWVGEPAGWRCMIFDADASGGDTPPGDTGGPGVGGDESLRDTSQAPPRPTNVRVRNGRLEWDMAASPSYVYQLTTNNSKIDDGQPWTQREVQNDSALTRQERAGGGTRFSYPVDGFRTGTTFRVEAMHPWDIDVSGPRGSSSRFATMPANGSGSTISDFLGTFGGDGSSSIPGSWIGTRDEWSSTPQFVDDFTGSSVSDKWYFADESITPAYSRDQTYSRDTAQVRDGKLVMSVDRDTGEYSYLGTGNNQGNGYHVDASNGTFVEASVKLDGATPADNAWWAFWLMTPDGGAYCDGVDTGSEVDIFELVPDQNNGFNSAIYTGDGSCGGNESTRKTRPQGRSFTSNTPNSLSGVNVPNYMDGDYHRLGMYYAHDRMAFYVDDVLFWEVTDRSFITKAEELSIRLTWELQNVNNPWTPGFGGDTSTSARDDDPTVLVDWVKVWERGSGGGTGDPDPDPDASDDPDPDPDAPVDPDPDPDPSGSGEPSAPSAPATFSAVVEGRSVQLDWTASSGVGIAGYNIERNGGYLATVDASTTAFLDATTVTDRRYVYEVFAFAESDGSALWGDRSNELRVHVQDGNRYEAAPLPGDGEPGSDAPAQGPGKVTDFEVIQPLNTQQLDLSWSAGPGATPTGYNVERNGLFIATVVGETTYTDRNIVPGQTYTYSVVAYSGPDDAPLFSPAAIASSSVQRPSTTVPARVGYFRATSQANVVAESGVSVQLSWNAPFGWRSLPIVGYEIVRDGVVIDTMNEPPVVVSSGSSARTYQDRTARNGRTHVYWVRAFRGTYVNPVLGPDSTPATITIDRADPVGSTPYDTDPATDPRFVRVIEAIAPRAPEADHVRYARIFWRLHLRVQNGQSVRFTDVRTLDAWLRIRGVDVGLGISEPVSDQTSLAGLASTLVRGTAGAGSLRDINAIIPAYAPADTRPWTSFRDRLPARGSGGEAHALRFVETVAQLQIDMDRIVPGGKARHSILRPVEHGAREAAFLLLGRQGGSGFSYGDYYNLFRSVEGSANGSPFGQAWASASVEERLEFYDIDVEAWVAAKPYLELAIEVDGIRDDIPSGFEKFLTVVFAIGLTLVTTGAATFLVAGVLGIAATSLTAMAIGAGIGAYVTTFILSGGSTSQSDKAFTRGLITGVLSYYSGLESLTRVQSGSVVILEAAFDSLNNDDLDFAEALGIILARDYIPGLSDALEGVENISPFLAGLLAELAASILIHGPDDWESISDDLEGYVLRYVGGKVTLALTEAVPESWGVLGETLADLVGKAIEFRGDPDRLREYFATTVLRTLSASAREAITEHFGGPENFLAEAVGVLSGLVIESIGMDDDARQKHIEDGLSDFVFDRLGEEVSTRFGNVLAAGNGGETNAYIEFFVGALDVIVSNAHKTPAEREAALRGFVQNELIGALLDAFPTCGVAGRQEIAEFLIAEALNGAPPGEDLVGAQNRVNSLVAQVRDVEAPAACRGGSGGGGGAGDTPPDTDGFRVLIVNSDGIVIDQETGEPYYQDGVQVACGPCVLGLPLGVELLVAGVGFTLVWIGVTGQQQQRDFPTVSDAVDAIPEVVPGVTNPVDGPHPDDGEAVTVNYDNSATPTVALHANAASLARTLENRRRNGWTAHHLIPRNLVHDVRFLPMFEEAAAAGWNINEPSNGTMLPFRKYAQMEYFEITGGFVGQGICLPLHAYNAKHRQWDADAETSLNVLKAEWERRRFGSDPMSGTELAMLVRGISAVQANTVVRSGYEPYFECYW